MVVSLPASVSSAAVLSALCDFRIGTTQRTIGSKKVIAAFAENCRRERRANLSALVAR